MQQITFDLFTLSILLMFTETFDFKNKKILSAIPEKTSFLISEKRLDIVVIKNLLGLHH